MTDETRRPHGGMIPGLSGGLVHPLGELGEYQDVMGKQQQRREDPVTAHRMRLDGYAEARALAHEAGELRKVADTRIDGEDMRGVATLMLERAKDLLEPEPKETTG